MNLTKNTIISLLGKEDFSAEFALADRIRQEHVGDRVHIRALLEFSNYCRRQCRYCGLNRNNSALERFRMQPQEIVETALDAKEAGYRTIVLQSGEDPYYTPAMIGEIVRKIKPCGIAVTLSCGEFDEQTYSYFKKCGADRYLLKHETSDPVLYQSLHPDSALKNRVDCQRFIKRAGLETGGGFMIGLPGQTLETVAQDLLLLKEIGCDMAGIGPFLPHPDTPLGTAPHGSAELTLRAVAIARMLLPNANLPATTALGVLDPGCKDLVFACGANVVMQKVTPAKLKRLYQIYPAKFQETDIASGRKQIEQEIREIGKIPY